MKIRNGFVSNSSSASYIVRIKDINFSDFSKLISEEFTTFYGMLSNEELIKRLNSNIKCRKTMMEFTGIDKENFEKTISILEETKQKIEKGELSIEELVKEALNINGIKIEEENGDLILNDFTAMHNSYVEGMNDDLKEIVLFMIFDTKYKVECKIEKD